LSNIYDLNSRRLKNGLSLPVLDTRKELEEGFRDSASLDVIIRLLEQGPTEEIPTGNVGVAFKGVSKEIDDFLSWILTDGRALAHDYGLLGIEQELAEGQLAKIRSVYTAQRKR
jgi:hypothetical protein